MCGLVNIKVGQGCGLYYLQRSTTSARRISES